MGTDELYPAEWPVSAQRATATATAGGYGDAFPYRTGHGSGLNTISTELIAL
ncbi:hypothetical protein ABZ671_30820 [Micromonospora sp. NPDC006766]|uniref:hypothetical protein n=1 Tax=Micromonospora sp. NPDC006766 TaxID=3154778 RepID=UPI0033C790CF